MCYCNKNTLTEGGWRMVMITTEEWRNQLNTDTTTAEEITRFIAELNAQARLGQLAPAHPDLWKRTVDTLNNALGIRPKELIVCMMDQYLNTLQCRELYRASGGNLKYAIEGYRNLSDLFAFTNNILPLELLGEFRYLFGKSVGDRITTAMKLTLKLVFDEKTAGMVIAGFETAVEQYVGLLLVNAKREAAAVFPLIDLFCVGNWPVCYFPEQERLLVLVA